MTFKITNSRNVLKIHINSHLILLRFFFRNVTVEYCSVLLIMLLSVAINVVKCCY